MHGAWAPPFASEGEPGWQADVRWPTALWTSSREPAAFEGGPPSSFARLPAEGRVLGDVPGATLFVSARTAQPSGAAAHLPGADARWRPAVLLPHAYRRLGGSSVSRQAAEQTSVGRFS